MNAMNLILALADRGIELTLDPAAGRVNAYPASKLTDEDRAAIRHHLPTIKCLLSVDYTSYPEGWQTEPALPTRAFLVRNGRLIDSSLFHTAAGAQELVHRMQRGEPLNLAVAAACAFEDARAKQTT